MRKEIEQDGFITDEIYIQETLPSKSNALEMTAEDRGKLMTQCNYPKCEDCICYVASVCTVPIVVSKQMWLEHKEWRNEVVKTFADIKHYINYIVDVWGNGARNKNVDDPERILYDKTIIEIAEESNEILDV